MSNFLQMVAMIDQYLINHGIDQNIKSTMHDVSVNKCDNTSNIVYVYNGKNNLDVLDMDAIAKNGYKVIKKPNDKPNNSADAFLINNNNEWFFIEFKDAPINESKISIIKKAYSNWYMLMDILFEMRGSGEEYLQFDFDNPIKFAQYNVTYIVVCSNEKNPQIYMQIKNKDLIGETYTPPFLEKIKTYIFKDVYAYTEFYFEKKFANKFTY